MPGRRRSDAAREEVALALATGATAKQAAARVGVHERTVRNWAAVQGFRDRVAELRRQLTDRTVDQLAIARYEAAVTARKLLRSDDPQARQKAADSILRETRPRVIEPPFGVGGDVDRFLRQLDGEEAS